MLDTHAAVWWLLDAPRLTRAARDVIASADAVYISAVSVMELAIGRLGAIAPAAEFVSGLEDSGFRVLAFDAADAMALAELPRLHRDPYDRALVAQARRRKLTLMTADGALPDYPLSVYRL